MAKNKNCFTGAMLIIALMSLVSACDNNLGKPADKIPPTVPNGVSITALSPPAVKIDWHPAADDLSGVKGYIIYRDGKFLNKVAETSFIDNDVTPKKKICYRVSTIDNAGNESPPSTEVCAIL